MPRYRGLVFITYESIEARGNCDIFGAFHVDAEWTGDGLQIDTIPDDSDLWPWEDLRTQIPVPDGVTPACAFVDLHDRVGLIFRSEQPHAFVREQTEGEEIAVIGTLFRDGFRPSAVDE